MSKEDDNIRLHASEILLDAAIKLLNEDLKVNRKEIKFLLLLILRIAKRKYNSDEVLIRASNLINEIAGVDLAKIKLSDTYKNDIH